VTAGNATTRAHLVWLGDRMFLALGHELLDVPAAGGTLRPVLTLPEDLRFGGNLQIINDGRDVLFSTSPPALWTVPMTGGEPRQVLGGVIAFRVTPTGHLLYTSVDETQLLGRAFREDTVEVAGDPVPLVELQSRGWESFGFSPNGMLAYTLEDAFSSELVWVDRSTGQADLIHPDFPKSPVQRVLLSPDGRFVVYMEQTATSGMRRLRAWDIAQQRASVLADDVRQFGFVGGTQALVFSREDSVFRLDFPWTSAPVPFSELRDQYRFWDATPDGRQLVVSRNSGSDWAVLNADGSGAPVPIEGLYSSFSPDGRWVAFSQGAVATAAELWVRPASVESKARWLVTEKAAVGWGFWSGDGREYFFSDRTGRWQSVTVRGDRPDAPFELGRIVPVNEPDDVILWDVTPDGSRFLARRTLPAAAPRRLAIVQNFFEELRAKVPVK